jgi:hypothetical protein
MTAGVLVFSLSLRDHITGNRRLMTAASLLSFVALVALASGAGFLLLMTYLMIHYLRTVRLSIRGVRLTLVYVFASFALIWFGIAWLNEIDEFDKASTIYYLKMYDLKMNSIENVFEDSGWLTILFGNQVIHGSEAKTSGDFGYVVTLGAIGVCGGLLVFMAPLLFFEGIPRVMIPTIFFYLSFVHYPGLLSPPGQVVFAYYLCVLARTRGRRRHGPGVESVMGSPVGALTVPAVEGNGT